MATVKSLEELAALVGGRFKGNGRQVITGVASIDEAGPGDITFVADRRHLKSLASTGASAVIMKDGGEEAEGLNLLLAGNPQLAFARIVDVFRPLVLPGPGVHPRAEVHPTAALGKGVSIQAFAVVEEGARIGGRTVLFPGVYIGTGAEVGEDSIVYPGVAVREGCRIGNRVVIHCNAVIGSDGFGYAREGARHVKLPQRGIVRIEDDVEIGACVTVDRASVGETVIGRGTKIDNLVQIGHNVKVGADTIIVAQTGISGSTRVGSRVTLGGQVGITGHVDVGDDSMIGAQSGVINSVPKGAVLSGMPAIAHGEWLRAQAVITKLPELKKKLGELEKRLKRLEGSEGD